MNYAGYMNSFLAKYWRLVIRNNELINQPVPVQQISPDRLAFDYSMLDMLNVKYLFTFDTPIFDSRFRPLNAEKPFIYENTQALPRVFFANSTAHLSGRRRIFDFMKMNGFDPRQTAIVESEPPFRTFPADSNHAEVTSYDIHQIKIKAKVTKPTILVLSEIYYPAGWKAYVNGVESKIYKTNYILRSIFLQPGEQDIEFIYSAQTFFAGVWTTFAVLLVLLSVIISSFYLNMLNRWKNRSDQNSKSVSEVNIS